MRHTVTVQLDDAIKAACLPFDYAFDGTSVFDVPEFDAPKRDGTWSIGLIVGPSGSGKSSLLKKHYGVTPDKVWDQSKAIVSQVSSERLSAVGLNSVPTWCRPYQVLSNGEAFRARLAAGLASDTAFDEFSSVVDRTVAKSCSYAVQRFIRSEKMTGVVFASCHYDIIEWLSPDWVFDTLTGRLALGRSLWRRSPINLDIHKCDSTLWKAFGPHHYLDGAINKASRCYCAFWDDALVAFSSVLAYPSGTVKNAWREHRTVVLPDYQGLGIGVRVSDWVARLYVEDGCRFFSKTAHPRMGEYRQRSEHWRPTSKNLKTRPDYFKDAKFRNILQHKNRLCYSHEYVLDPIKKN